MPIRDDYLMRLILNLARAIAKAISRSGADGERETVDLEDAIGEAVNMDPELFFSLEPESMVMMLGIGDMNTATAEHVVRAMYVDAEVIREAGDSARADLRERQADAIAQAYGCAIEYELETAEELAQPFLDVLEAEGQD